MDRRLPFSTTSSIAASSVSSSIGLARTAIDPRCTAVLPDGGVAVAGDENDRNRAAPAGKALEKIEAGQLWHAHARLTQALLYASSVYPASSS
jgi:hypothetical protein